MSTPAQIWHRLRLMLAQGVVTLVGKDNLQAKILDAEVQPNIRRVTPYGFAHFPKVGAQAYLAFPSGDRAQGIALVVGDKRYVLELESGEVALHDDEGNFVKLGRGGVVTVKANTELVINAPKTTFTGELWASGKRIDSSHKHTAQGATAVTSAVN